MNNLKISFKLLLAFGVLIVMMLAIGFIMFYTSGQFSNAAEISNFVIEKEVDHFVWVGKVKDLFLYNHSELDVQLDPTKCSLGKWFYSFKVSEEFKRLPEDFREMILKLEEPHTDLHHSAADIDKIWRQEHNGLQETLLKKLDDHNIWAINVMTGIISNTAITVETDPTKCELGQWFVSDSFKNYQKDWKEFDNLVKEMYTYHDALHNSVFKINKIDDQKQRLQIFKTDTLVNINSVSDIVHEINELEESYKQIREQSFTILTDKTEPILHEVQGILKNITKKFNELKTEVNTNMLSSVIIIITASIIISVIIILLLLRSITYPLRTVISLSNSVAEGDLTLNVPEKLLKRTEEFGNLANSLNNMIKQLRKVAATVKSASVYVSSGSQQLTSSAQQLSQGASEQAASVEEISSSIEEVSSTIQQNSDNADQTEKIAVKSAADAREGGVAVQKTVEAMKKIADKINIIQDIARQTNLLSVNASIEAARAGEAGMGFAVVAAQVQKLADKSQIAAEEINNLSRSSVNVALEAGDMLERLVPDIQKTAELVQEINAASLEQSSGIQQINDAIQQLNSVVQENAASAEETSATAEQLSSQSTQLQNTISFFNVEREEEHFFNNTAEKSKLLNQLKDLLYNAQKNGDKDPGNELVINHVKQLITHSGKNSDKTNGSEQNSIQAKTNKGIEIDMKIEDELDDDFKRY